MTPRRCCGSETVGMAPQRQAGVHCVAEQGHEGHSAAHCAPPAAHTACSTVREWLRTSRGGVPSWQHAHAVHTGQQFVSLDCKRRVSIGNPVSNAVEAADSSHPDAGYCLKCCQETGWGCIAVVSNCQACRIITCRHRRLAGGLGCRFARLMRLLCVVTHGHMSSMPHWHRSTRKLLLLQPCGC